MMTLMVATPDDRLRDAVHGAFVGHRSPVADILYAPDVAALLEIEPLPSDYWLVDPRTEGSELLFPRVPGDVGPVRPPILWLDPEPAPDGQTATAPSPGFRGYLPTPDLAWDERLAGVPFRTAPSDESFGGRLRTRVALLPGDAAAEHLYYCATIGPPAAWVPAEGGGLAWRPAAERPPETWWEQRPDVVPIRRTTDDGNALLRLILRPEQYQNGVGHAVLAASEATPARQSPERHHASRRRAFYRACETAGLVAPADIAHVALVCRACHLASALHLGPGHLGKLLGFAAEGRADRPVRSTLQRALAKVDFPAPADLRWHTFDEWVEQFQLALRGEGLLYRTPAARPSTTLARRGASPRSQPGVRPSVGGGRPRAPRRT